VNFIDPQGLIAYAPHHWFTPSLMATPDMFDPWGGTLWWYPALIQMVTQEPQLSARDKLHSLREQLAGEVTDGTEVGFKGGVIEGAALARLWEVINGTPDNRGDISLGIRAAEIGNMLRLSRDVNVALRQIGELCKK
jgi:hypothetical protein